MATTIILDTKEIRLGRHAHLIEVILTDTALQHSWRDLSEVMLAETTDQTRGMLINLNQVQHLDSRGVGLLAMMAVNLDKKKIRMAIVGISEITRQLFRASRLDHIARFFTRTEDAVRSFEMDLLS